MASTGPMNNVAQLAKLPNVGWQEFNDKLSTQRHSPLDQINADNVGKLAIAWRWQAGMFGPNPELENVCPCPAKGVDRSIRGQCRVLERQQPGYL